MKNWAIVRKEDYAILGTYKSNAKQDTTKHRSWLQAEPICIHIEVAEDLDQAHAHAHLVNGEMVVSEYTEAKAAAKLAALRSVRDGKLAACDWTQLPDVPMGSGQKAEWRTYRQALRDITDSCGCLDTVVWPAEPPAEV